MRGILVSVLLLAASPAAAAPFAHVRSEDAAVQSWLADGYARSATFRALVDEIDGLPGIVYIEATVAVPLGLDGALLHSVAGSRDLPLLRVLVRWSLSRATGIATIAHELQHVAEVLRAGQTADSAAISALFGSIGETRSTGSRHFETADAKRVTRRVLDELDHNRPR